MYQVLSPDGFGIACEPFKTKKLALQFYENWKNRFKEQGFYSTGNREHIAIEDLDDCCSLEKV